MGFDVRLEALRGHHLHAVARRNVFHDPSNGRLVFGAPHVGAGQVMVELGARQLGQGTTQPPKHPLDLGGRLLVTLARSLRQDDDADDVLGVIEHDDGVREHHRDIVDL